MKSMNKKEGKKIGVMTAVILGLMMFAFMPLASATVTSFAVTPSSGIAGLVDSYDALVTTDGVTTINISIPMGFIAVEPAIGGVQIARVTFWNQRTKAYYGYATITSNAANPTTGVDIYCEFGDDTVTTTNKTINYTAGATSTFESGFPTDNSSAIIKLPTETEEGSIKISIGSNCTGFKLEDVSINIGEFVRNPLVPGAYYPFIADGETVMVTITAPIGCGAVFRKGLWYADTDGDHQTDIWYQYGIAGDKPAVGDVDNNGINDIIAYRDGHWYVSKEDHTGTSFLKSFWYGGVEGDIPVLGDYDNNGTVDTIIYRNGQWWVRGVGRVFNYGVAGDIPLVADYDNDGENEVIIYRNGQWWIKGEGLKFTYGVAGDKPIVDDIGNDGSNDIAVLRGGRWWVWPDFSEEDYNFMYGIPGDVPILNKFV